MSDLTPPASRMSPAAMLETSLSVVVAVDAPAVWEKFERVMAPQEKAVNRRFVTPGAPYSFTLAMAELIASL